MRVTVTERPPAKVAGDVVVSLFEASRRRRKLPLSSHLHARAGRWVSHETDAMTWLETRRMKAPRALLVCVGDPAPQTGRGGRNGSLERDEIERAGAHELRVLGGMIERACHAQGVKRIVIADVPARASVIDLVEGMILRAHSSDEWREANAETSITQVTICVAGEERAAVAEAMEARRIMAEATNWCRLLADTPGNLGTPAHVVSRARERLEPLGLKLTEISRAEARSLGMGLFAAVDQGASASGRILVVEHRPAGTEESDPLLAFVGKGVTHDTGGYNIKTTPSLHELTYDKCGAMAVLGAMEGIARMALDAWVVGVCPLVENCVDAEAYKPGDILEAHNGATVYIENTDAEGRLILGDCLSWIAERQPEVVVDVATLTGASHAALGEAFAAMFANDSDARELVQEASWRSDDPVWAMPIDPLHDRELGHHKADLKNIGVRGGSACSAAAFLRNFVDYAWVHVDIAGKAHADFSRGYYGHGATGFGCRLLMQTAILFSDQYAPVDDDTWEGAS